MAPVLPYASPSSLSGAYTVLAQACVAHLSWNERHLAHILKHKYKLVLYNMYNVRHDAIMEATSVSREREKLVCKVCLEVGQNL